MPLLILVGRRVFSAVESDEDGSMWGGGGIGAEDIQFWIRGGEATAQATGPRFSS